MRHRRRTRLIRRLVLGFAIALVAVPAAQAYPDEGTKGQKTIVQGVDDFPGSAAIITRGEGDLPVRGEIKAGLGATPGGPIVLAERPDNRPDRSWPEVMSQPTQVVSNPSGGFDWGDAGIGAGTAFGLVLIGVGAALATRHVGRPAQV